MEKLWKATGVGRTWFALIEGDETPLPCVHRHWWKSGTIYKDPFHLRDWNKLHPYIDALKAQRRAILTNDRIENDIPVEREGYIAEYAIEDLIWDDKTGLSFRFTKVLRKMK